jgi:hypothetical protein
MKKGFIKFSLIGIVSIFLLSTVQGQTKKIESKIIEPTAKEAIRQILLNGAAPLSAAKNCQSVGTSAADKTILDFLSGVLSFQTAPDSTNRIEFAFKQDKGKQNEVVWVCDLSFKGRDAEDVWSNGIRFKMRNADRKLMRESLMCLGTG